jgi:flagellar basal body-associated protein FliL
MKRKNETTNNRRNSAGFALVLLRALGALIVASLLLGAGAAWASSGGGGHAKPKKPKETTAEEGVPAGPRVPSVSMPVLVAPVVVDGQLHHYAYLSVTLQLADDGHKTLVLEKIPYLQDAFLREVHGASIALDNNPEVVDERNLNDRLVAVSGSVLGPGIVTAIKFRNVTHPAS